MENWMIYGAYGFTGALIVKEALARGHRPLLAGRNRGKLAAQSQETGLESVVTDLEDESALAQAVANVDLVLNAAGPYTKTSRPMIQACLAGSSHYLDICGEHYVLEETLALDKLAREAGRGLIPGVGFDVIPTDCLARYLSEKMPTAVKLEMAIAALTRPSVGTVGTSMEIFSRGCVARKNGLLEPCAYGRGKKEIRFSHGKRWQTMPVPWADLATAYYSTGIPNITVYMALDPRLLKLVGPGTSLAQWLLSSEAVRNMSKGLVKKIITTQGQESSEKETSYIWARVTGEEGAQIEAWMETDESYRFTAAAAVRCVEMTAAANPIGALTPAQAFGPDFVLELEGSKRMDSLPFNEPNLV